MSKVPEFIQEEIAHYQKEVERYRNGETDEEKFKRFRLQHGIYGQRQANVQMVRIKIPGGFLNAAQLSRIADITEKYAPLKIAHLTTRQDIQLHFIPLEHTPDIMTALAEVGLTTREACGNTVRNVTSCHFAGISRDEVFDIRPYMFATSRHFLRNPVCQSMPRKFKMAFEGCAHDHARIYIHDVGVQAKLRKSSDGKIERGFKLVVAGGLSTVPIIAHVFSEWVPEEELIPLIEAILRIFDRYGERKVRSRARIKFLVQKWGIEKFREEVNKERKLLHVDPSWNAYLKDIDRSEDEKIASIEPITPVGQNGFRTFLKTNVIPQKQKGLSIVQVKLLRGDASPDQYRTLARLIQEYGQDEIRISIEQNLLIPGVQNHQVEKLHGELKKIELGESGAEGLLDITSCPGADTCNLGITSSRGLTLAIQDELKKSNGHFSEIDDIHIKISGCPNSCGQHHIASIGYHGASQNAGDRTIPSFILLLGGVANAKGTRYAQSIMKIPSKAVPQATAKLISHYLASKKEGEPFEDFYQNYGKDKVKELLKEFAEIPKYEEKPNYYTDWSQEEEFSLKKGMQGECAGAAVQEVQVGLDDAVALLASAKKEAQESHWDSAFQKAHKAIAVAATAILVSKGVDPLTDEEAIQKLENHFVLTGEFPDQFKDLEHRVRQYVAGSKTSHTAEAFLAFSGEIIKESEKHFYAFAENIEGGKSRETGQSAPQKEASNTAFLDLRGVRCPINYVQTKIKLSTMQSGEVLQIVIDEGEAYANVPNSVRNDGHEILEEQKLNKAYQLKIRKK